MSYLKMAKLNYEKHPSRFFPAQCRADAVEIEPLKWFYFQTHQNGFEPNKNEKNISYNPDVSCLCICLRAKDGFKSQSYVDRI